jgi:hypothetical protein
MNGSKEDALRAVLRASLRGRDEQARDLLGELVAGGSGPGADPDALQDYIFASALSRRLDPARTAEINLYLQQFELQQIALFNLLAQHLPTVSLAVSVSNEVLAGFLGGRDEVALLDLGIGTGRQEVALLRELAARGDLPGRLTVFAVEPDAESLRQAGEALRGTAEEIGLELEFHPLNLTAEQLEDEHWALFGSARGPLVMHAAFAAHHIRDRGDGYCARTDFFRKLRLLSPLAVVLCEPSSDHHTPLLGERFENAWRHFGKTFDLIDRAGLPPREAAAIKMFFAREIYDIVGNAEEARCERHESAGAWVERLRRAGFTPYEGFALSERVAHDAVQIRPREGFVGLDYAGETLVAVVCATTDAAAAQASLRPSARVLQVA